MLALSERSQATLFRLAAGLGAALAVSYAIMLAVWREDGVRRAIVADWLIVVGGVLAIACVLVAARVAGPPTGRGRVAWGLLAAALAVALLGDLLWALDDQGARLPSLLPLADALYALFYPLAILAVLHLPALPLSRGERVRLLLDMVLVLLCAGLATWSFWFRPLALAGQADAARLAYAVAYPMGDVALLFALIALLFRPLETRAWPLLLLAAGFAALLLSDLVYASQYLVGQYAGGGLADAGWLATYLLFGTAAVVRARTSGARALPFTRSGRGLPAWLRAAQPYLPFLILLAAYPFLLWARPNLQPFEFQVVGIFTGGLILLVLIRQGMVVARNSQALRAEHRRREADALLIELSRRLLGAADETNIARSTVEIASAALHADLSLLVLPDLDGRLTVRASRGGLPDRAVAPVFEPGAASQIGFTLLHGQPVQVDDYSAPRPFQVDPWLLEQGSVSGLSVPLNMGGRAVGGLLVTSRQARHFGDDDARLLTVIANQTVAAFEKGRLFDVTRRQIDELTVLHAVATACAEAADEDAVIERVTGIVGDTLYPNHLGFMLLDPAASLLRSHPSYRGDSGYVTALGRGITGYVALTGQPALLADVSVDPRYVAVEPDIRSELCVPLAAGEEVLGVINVESTSPAYFSEADERLMSTIARQVATAIAKLRLFERLFQAEQQRAGELEAVRQASLGLTASLDLAAVLKAILNTTLRMVPDAREAFVFEYHNLDGGRLTIGTSLARDGALRGDWQPRQDGLTYAVARRAEVMIVPDVRASPLFSQGPNDWGLALIGLPLKIGSRVVGVMNVIYPEPREFAESELRVLRLLGDQAAIAIENARLFEAERSTREQAEALREVAATLGANLDRKQLLGLILEQLGRVVEYDSASIMLFDGDRLAVVADSGFRAESQHNLRQAADIMPLLGDVVVSARPVIIADTTLDPRWRSLPGAEYIRCWLGVPLSTQGRTLGLLNLDKSQPDFYTSRHAELAAAFANQAAVAIENARLLAGERRQLSLAQTLQEVGALLTAQMTLDEVFEHIFDLLAQVVAYDSVSVQLLGPDGGMQLAAGRGFPDLVIARENVRYVAEKRRPETWLDVRLIVVSDTATDPRWIHTDGTAYIRSWIGAALMVKGQLVGVLTTESAVPGAYDAAAGETVQAFANQAAVAIENARLFEDSQRQTRALSGLYDTALATGSVLETEVLVRRLHDQVRSLLNPDTFVVMFYHAASEELEVVLAIEDGRPAEEVLPAGRLPVGQGLTGWVVRNRRSLLVRDLQEEQVPVPPRHGLRPARSWLGVPLIARDQIIGAVSVQSFEAEAFDAADARFLESVASQVAIAIENARLYAEVSARAGELSRLYAAAKDLGATLEPQAVLEQLARHLTEAVDVTSGYVMEVNLATDSLIVLAEYWSPAALPEERASDQGRVYSLADNPAVKLAITQLTVVERHTDEPGFSDDERAELLAHGVKSMLIVPIVARRQVLGEAELWETRARRSFTEAERRLVQTLCQHAAGVIENARLFEETVRHATEVTGASEILHLLNAATNISDNFPQISAAIKAITGCERVSIALLDENQARVTMLVLDQPRRELPRGGAFPVSATAAANDVLAGRVHLTPELADESEFPAEQALFRAGFHSRLNLPLRVGTQVIGSLNLVWNEPSGYVGANLPLLTQLGDAIALAMEKTRLFEEARRRDAILEALAYASGQLLMPGAADDAMPDLLAALGTAANVSRAYIFFNHAAPDGAPLASLRYEWTAPGVPSQQVQPDWQDLPYVSGGLRRWMEVLAAGRPLDGLVRELPPPERGRLERLGVLSVAIVPIFSGGDWWGWLGFDDCVTERVWSAAEIEALKSTASALGAYLTRQRAEEAEREQRALAEALRDTAAILNSTLNLDEVLDHILADVGHVVPHEAANIMLIDSGEARVVRNRDVLSRFPAEYMLKVRYVVAEVPNLKYMLETGQTAIITDAQAFPGWFVRPETGWIRSTVGSPILIKGHVIGFITLDTSQPGYYTPAQAERLQAFAQQAGLAIENARLYASIRQHAEELEQRVGERTRELASANRRLTELDRLKDQFVSNVSHELRTPLTNIKLHLSLLEKRGPEVLPRYLPTLQRETERLRRLIEDLLDLSRLQTQSGPAQRDPYLLDEMITEVLTVHAARAEAKNITLVHQPLPEPLLVPVDRAQMIQVFTNLVSNAVSYTPPGGQATVSAEKAQVGKTPGINIAFINTGPLIPAEDRPHLFRRFYRGRTAHDSGEPGTGLGLAICRDIVVRHGGQIEVTADDVRGNVFNVWLPLT